MRCPSWCWQVPLHGTLTLKADGRYRYTPNADYNGTEVLRLKLFDGMLESNEASLTLSVTAVNDAPVLGDQSVSLLEDGSVTLSPLASAYDVDGGALTASIVAGPVHGTLTVNADGSFTYAPDADYFGADSYSYVVNDGALASNVATVNLTIAAVNDAPVARDGAATLNEDGSLVFDLRTLGLDVDSATLSAVIVDGPAHGTLSLQADGSYRYTPCANFNGSDVLRFKLSDGALESNLASVSLTIAAVNDAPVLVDRSASLLEDGSITLAALATASDIDGDGLKARIVAGPAHGQVTVNGDGSFTYTADANYFGADSSGSGCR